MWVQGSLSARGERILFLDADGATEIADVERLERTLDEISSSHVSKSKLCRLTYMHSFLSLFITSV